MADADPKMKQDAAIVLDEPPLPAPEAKPRRHLLRPLLMFGVPAVVLAIVGWFWLTSGGSVGTENAYVQQDKVSVSADVSGRIVEVAVRENQAVKKGDLLFRIDPEPYRIALSQAEAAIAGAQVELQTLRTSYAGTSADIQAARDRISAAQQDFDRQSELMKRGFTTRARLEEAQHGLEQARAALQGAEAEADEARSKLATGAAVPGPEPRDRRCGAPGAKRPCGTLSRTEIRAPRGRHGQPVGPAPGRPDDDDRAARAHRRRQPRLLDRGQFQGNRPQQDARRPVRRGQARCLSGLKLKGHVASIGAGHGLRILGAAGAERQRQTGSRSPSACPCASRSTRRARAS